MLLFMSISIYSIILVLLSNLSTHLFNLLSYSIWNKLQERHLGIMFIFSNLFYHPSTSFTSLYYIFPSLHFIIPLEIMFTIPRPLFKPQLIHLDTLDNQVWITFNWKLHQDFLFLQYSYLQKVILITLGSYNSSK